MRTWSVIVLVAVTLLGAVELLHGGPQPAAPQVGTRLTALRQERVTIARQVIESLERQRNNGAGGGDAEFGQWERRLFEAEAAAAAGDNAARTAAAERYVDSARKHVERVQKLYDAARAAMADVLRAKYDLTDAECALEESKGR